MPTKVQVAIILHFLTNLLFWLLSFERKPVISVRSKNLRRYIGTSRPDLFCHLPQYQTQDTCENSHALPFSRERKEGEKDRETQLQIGESNRCETLVELLKLKAKDYVWREWKSSPAMYKLPCLEVGSTGLLTGRGVAAEARGRVCAAGSAAAPRSAAVRSPGLRQDDPGARRRHGVSRDLPRR